MIYPTIPLNGTSKEALLKGWLKMSDALNEALTAMIENGPNARDYCRQGDDGYAAARHEHDLRILKISEVRDEVDAIVEHIADCEGH